MHKLSICTNTSKIYSLKSEVKQTMYTTKRTIQLPIICEDFKDNQNPDIMHHLVISINILYNKNVLAQNSEGGVDRTSLALNERTGVKQYDPYFMKSKGKYKYKCRQFIQFLKGLVRKCDSKIVLVFFT